MRAARWWGVGGAALLLTGALGLGWELWGTNVVSQRTHERLVAELRTDWSTGRDVRLAALHEPRHERGEAYGVVRIPRFGAEYAVPLLEGAGDDELADGFGHMVETGRLGAVGNVVLAGHRVTHGEPLKRMPELRPGDRVTVETERATYVYVLDTGGDDLVVDDTAMWVTAGRPDNPEAGGVEPVTDSRRLLTLVTCAELFHTDDRLVAFGHLVEVRGAG